MSNPFARVIGFDDPDQDWRYPIFSDPQAAARNVGHRWEIGTNVYKIAGGSGDPGLALCKYDGANRPDAFDPHPPEPFDDDEREFTPIADLSPYRSDPFDFGEGGTYNLWYTGVLVGRYHQLMEGDL